MNQESGVLLNDRTATHASRIEVLRLAAPGVKATSLLGRFATAGLCLLLFCFFSNPISAAQEGMTSLGILDFINDSAVEAPSGLGRALARQLQQHLVSEYQDVLPRLVDPPSDDSAQNRRTIEEIGVQGKQSGVQFMVRGGLLAVSSEEVDGEAEVRVQLYAELINADSTRIQSFRARGIGRQPAPGFDLDGLLATADLRSSSFRKTALGKALSSAIEQLSTSVHEAIASPLENQVAETDPGAQPTEDDTFEDEEAESEEELADEDSDIGAEEEPLDEEAAEYTAENDEDLQQLIAQAQVLLDDAFSLSSEDLDTLTGTVERLQTALDSKVELLQSGEDTGEAEQEIAQVSEELRSLRSSLSEEETYAEADPESYEEPSEERRGLLESLNDILGQTNNAIQQVQQIHSSLAGTPGYADTSAEYPPDSEEFPAEEEYSEPSEGETESAEAFDESESEEGLQEEEGTPYQEPLEEVSGVITESGEPAEGVTVIDSETGVSAITDSEGYYTLKGVPGGRVAKLMVADEGKQVAMGHVNLAKGAAGIADFELQPGAAAPANSKIIPYAVPVKAGKNNRANTGTVRGVVRSAQGKPVPRALVQLEGLGVARTDSKGQYIFKNVPAGVHQLKIRKGSSLLQSQQVKVEPRQATLSQTQLAAGTVPKRMGQSLVARGTGTILRGVISDGQRPIGKAKVTLVQPAGALSSATRSNGKYAFRDLKPGSYRVLVSRAGYERLSSIVALRAGQTQVHDLQLKKSEILPAVARAKTPTRVTGSKAAPQVAKVTRPKTAKAIRTVPRVTKSTTAKKTLATKTVPKVATAAARPIAPGEVRGQVRGPNRKGLSNARVELIDLAGNRIRGRSTTGSDGQYSIKAPAGRYRLKAGHSSALAAAKSITVPAGAAVRHDFDLRKSQVAVQKPVKRPAPTLAKSKTTTRVIPALRPPSKSAPAIAGGGLRGRVTDAKTKRPVAGARVSISGGSPNVQKAIGTDRQGNYAVGSLPPGRYRVAVSKSGYSQVAGNLGVQSGKSTNFDIRLPAATSKQAIAAKKPASQSRIVVPKVQVRQGRLTGRIVDAGNGR